jgi:hypothetical protein
MRRFPTLPSMFGDPTGRPFRLVMVDLGADPDFSLYHVSQNATDFQPKATLTAAILTY